MGAVSARFPAAVEYARQAHDGQTRKGTTIAYLSHLLAVAALVLEHGGDEDQAIAGLLHDAVEDGGEHHQAQIAEQFGPRVARIVASCTDGTAESKAAVPVQAEQRLASWRARKQAYLQHLGDADADVLLVSGCDKLHNARAIVSDQENPAVGNAVFARFNAGRDDTLAYYHSLAGVFAARQSPVAAALAATVARMHALAGQDTARPLGH
ncbi:guanosine polyphosphate pyrophosphohydrolase [Stenotrophomonas ginsengisoli]|uniref:Guanosine polyphosphate pyrophosphohydrolase n=1 Tax=Stenotrophomonas ginsengisoli TaxID=336566 RepID=A0A0R0D393_9GAMM|nr:HD domain-containing protein [Stenotrophomonas ginsengisoli]KRG75963.1 guanosine polyphosphate pyrophosphohydrolase [Stenotrophomonas ginsengisoli]